MKYNTLVERRLSNFKLNRENAIIGNISKRRIFDAEVIAKKEFVPKETAVMRAYRETQSLQDPLYKINQAQLKAIVDQPPRFTRLKNAFIEAFKAIKDTDEGGEGERSEEGEPIIEEVFDEPTEPEEPEQLPTGSHKIGQHTFMDIRVKTKDDLDQMDVHELRKYTDDYKVELEILKSQMSRDSVTRTMKQHGSFDKHNKVLHEAGVYGSFLDKYLRWREWSEGGDPSSLGGTSIMTNLEDLLERFKILYGEITSGNENVKVINEFREIIYYLYKNGYIPKDAYNTLMLKF